jgi:cytosine/adenosine deaminase-related metal-dependent hydrolase
VKVLSADWIVPVDGAPIPDGAVAIDDAGLIAAVGPASELGRGERFEAAVIMPGFVNAHSHLEYAVYAGFGDGFSFAPWIALHIERKSRLDFAEMEAIARSGAAASLASGVTTVGDASFSGAAATACAELGLRAIVYLEVFGAGTGQISERFESNRDRVSDAWSDCVRLGVSPHSLYSASLELWEAAAGLELPMMTHFFESPAEAEWIRGRTGPFAAIPFGFEPSPLGLLAERGLLSDRLVAAHCVHLADDEIALLAEHDVAVAHCPRSNALLGCGVAPLRELRGRGLRVGLGTDSPASTPSFDMFEELRFALMTARAREHDPEALTTAAALELATLGGARALGLEHELGSLTPGKHADLVVVSLEGSPFEPVEDPVTALVLGGSPDRLAATLVSGRERYRKGSTEWRELTDAARSARSHMLR